MKKFIYFFPEEFDDKNHGVFNEKGKIYSYSDEGNESDGCVEVEVTQEQLNDIFNYKYLDGQLVYNQEKADRDRLREETQRQENVLKMVERRTMLMSMDDETALQIPLMFDEWELDVDYITGYRVRYLNKLYKCLQSHKSEVNREPDKAVSLWVEISDPSIEYPPYKQPTGVHDAYNTGDKVTFEDKHYICLNDHVVHSPKDLPGAWKLVE